MNLQIKVAVGIRYEFDEVSDYVTDMTGRLFDVYTFQEHDTVTGRVLHNIGDLVDFFIPYLKECIPKIVTSQGIYIDLNRNLVLEFPFPFIWDDVVPDIIKYLRKNSNQDLIVNSSSRLLTKLYLESTRDSAYQLGEKQLTLYSNTLPQVILEYATKQQSKMREFTIRQLEVCMKRLCAIPLNSGERYILTMTRRKIEKAKRIVQTVNNEIFTCIN